MKNLNLITFSLCTVPFFKCLCNYRVLFNITTHGNTANMHVCYHLCANIIRITKFWFTHWSWFKRSVGRFCRSCSKYTYDIIFRIFCYIRYNTRLFEMAYLGQLCAIRFRRYSIFHSNIK